MHEFQINSLWMTFQLVDMQCPMLTRLYLVQLLWEYVPYPSFLFLGKSSYNLQIYI